MDWTQIGIRVKDLGMPTMYSPHYSFDNLVLTEGCDYKEIYKRLCEIPDRLNYIDIHSSIFNPQIKDHAKIMRLYLFIVFIKGLKDQYGFPNLNLEIDLFSERKKTITIYHEGKHATVHTTDFCIFFIPDTRIAMDLGLLHIYLRKMFASKFLYWLHDLSFRYYGFRNSIQEYIMTHI